MSKLSMILWYNYSARLSIAIIHCFYFFKFESRFTRKGSITHDETFDHSCCRWLHYSWRNVKAAVAGQVRSDTTHPRPAASRTRARDASTTRICPVTFADRTIARSPVARTHGTMSICVKTSLPSLMIDILSTFARPTFVRTHTMVWRKFQRYMSSKSKIKIDRRNICFKIGRKIFKIWKQRGNNNST